MYLDYPTLMLLLLLAVIIGRLSTPVQRAGLTVIRDIRRARARARTAERPARRRRRRSTKARAQ
jgi:hypothetical protein